MQINRLFNSFNKKIWKIQNSYHINKSKSEVMNYKNKYHGARCFIIGNGPSLRTEDLEALSGEITFGCNRIYKIFDKTSWRPTFYCIQDYEMILNYKEDINRIAVDDKFMGIVKDNKYSYDGNFKYIEIEEKEFYPDPPLFSADITDRIYEGLTVTYMSLQLAVYMGFKEIYLLGVDHNYSVDLKVDGTVMSNEGVSSYFDVNYNEKAFNLPQTDRTTYAYIAAKNYADENGIRIINATRGGKLEVFERISFD